MDAVDSVWKMNEQVMIGYTPWYYCMYMPFDIPWYILLIYIVTFIEFFMVYTINHMVYTIPYIP
jgi:hypothetical protein